MLSLGVHEGGVAMVTKKGPDEKAPAPDHADTESVGLDEGGYGTGPGGA